MYEFIIREETRDEIMNPQKIVAESFTEPISVISPFLSIACKTENV